MTEKIEVALTFVDFANKNRSAIELKQPKAETYQKLLYYRSYRPREIHPG